MIIRFAQPDDFALIEPALRFYRRLGGGFGATASETLFGEEIDVTSVERDDLVELSGQTSREAI